MNGRFTEAARLATQVCILLTVLVLMVMKAMGNVPGSWWAVTAPLWLLLLLIKTPKDK